MPETLHRMRSRTRPRLNKRYVATHDDYDVYAVNTYAVRSRARPDEEFGNFATQEEFPDLIPKGEIWLSDKALDREGVFFIANALERFKREEEGASEDTAYTAGLSVERQLRERLNGIKFRGGRPHRRVPPRIYFKHYTTIPDRKFDIDVWLVDGNMVRSFYKTDYTEGGHGYVYPWVPKHEIWIEKDLHPRELPYILSHEYIELRLMRDEGIDYDTAHEICSSVEYKMRKGKGAKRIMVPQSRHFTKQDLPKLTEDEVFRYVLRNYVRKK